jgi:hypothetical protein
MTKICCAAHRFPLLYINAIPEETTPDSHTRNYAYQNRAKKNKTSPYSTLPCLKKQSATTLHNALRHYKQRDLTGRNNSELFVALAN